MKVNLLHLSDVEWCYREVERQNDLSAEHVAGMGEALLHARMLYPKPITPEMIRQFNYCVKGIGFFRNINLSFPTDALEWQVVEDAVDALCKIGDDLSPFEWVYEFLKIHPFIDGNGRVAAICFNYLQGTLEHHKLYALPEFDVLEEVATRKG